MIELFEEALRNRDLARQGLRPSFKLRKRTITLR